MYLETLTVWLRLCIGVGWSKLTRRMMTDGRAESGREGGPDAKQAGHGHGWGMTEKKERECERE